MGSLSPNMTMNTRAQALAPECGFHDEALVLTPGLKPDVGIAPMHPPAVEHVDPTGQFHAVTPSFEGIPDQGLSRGVGSSCKKGVAVSGGMCDFDAASMSERQDVWGETFASAPAILSPRVDVDDASQDESLSPNMNMNTRAKALAPECRFHGEPLV